MIDDKIYISMKEYKEYLGIERLDNVVRCSWYKKYCDYIKNELHQEPYITKRGRYDGNTHLHWLIASYYIITNASPKNIHRLLMFATNCDKQGVEYFKYLLLYHDITVEKQKEKSYVYFIYDESNNMTKIGYSKNPEERFKTIKCTNSSNLKLEWKIQTYNAQELEKRLHELVTNKSIKRNGEWFNINETHKKYLKDYAENFSELNEYFGDEEVII